MASSAESGDCRSPPSSGELVEDENMVHPRARREPPRPKRASGVPLLIPIPPRGAGSPIPSSNPMRVRIRPNPNGQILP